ncbi:hypothetical protein RSOLAG22IIIB_11243 [Rhizoctonia solani]|uniref:Uncharacterized protein n=1 Tax=Rhizoctonia solani TaxID=456999 RepID=A0A0K6G7A6_9AGAM|nr:hypothetical protein RSOLAG22IIIB_11243 [Rhizoctonia solani]
MGKPAAVPGNLTFDDTANSTVSTTIGPLHQLPHDGYSTAGAFEASTRVSREGTTVFHSSSLPSSPSTVTPGTESLPVLAPVVAQDLGFTSYPLAPLASRPENAPSSCPPEWKSQDLVSQLRPEPQVKVCVLCTGDPDVPVLLDTALILQSLARFRNIDPNHIIIRTSQLIDVALDKFFDPTDVSEGAILILIVSCHGFQGYGGNVLLQFKTQHGATVDSRLLQAKIMALPKHCTLEVIVDTCRAENVIPGLQRIFTMDPSAPCSMPAGSVDYIAAHSPPSGSRPNTMVSLSWTSCDAKPSALFPIGLPKYASSLFEQAQPKYKARVIVWAASTGSGNSFTEEHFPDKPGLYSIMIGAIFRQLGSNGPGISRRSIWENLLGVVEQHNSVRSKRDLRKSPEIQIKLKNRTQRAILLTSVDNPDHVLNGTMFQPV